MIATANGHTATLANAIPAAGSAFSVRDTSSTFPGSTITNNGTLRLNSAGNNAQMLIGDTVALQGTGVLALSNESHNLILGGTPTHGNQLSNAAGRTLQASGATTTCSSRVTCCLRSSPSWGWGRLDAPGLDLSVR